MMLYCYTYMMLYMYALYITVVNILETCACVKATLPNFRKRTEVILKHGMAITLAILHCRNLSRRSSNAPHVKNKTSPQAVNP